jgi:hypothetical protein
MKKLILTIALISSGFAFEKAIAQVRVHINVNIPQQPVWGPVGYDYAEYYYLPDIDAYYYVPRHQYIYQQRGRWIFSSSLPPQYRNYDLNSGYKVVINDDPRPYRNDERYRAKYSSYKDHHDQRIIRNSDDQRYFEIKDHPQHDKWKKDHKDENRGRHHHE